MVQYHTGTNTHQIYHKAHEGVLFLSIHNHVPNILRSGKRLYSTIRRGPFSLVIVEYVPHTSGAL